MKYIFICLVVSSILAFSTTTRSIDKLDENRYRVVVSLSTQDNDTIDNSFIVSGENQVRSLCNNGDEIVSGGCVIYGYVKEFGKIITNIPDTLEHGTDGWLCEANVVKPRRLPRIYKKKLSGIAAHSICRKK
jgi:hypothetical protein